MIDTSRVFEPPFFAFPVVKTSAYDGLAAAGLPPAKLVAITAPTGYGKSVLMSCLHKHYQRGGANCLWVGLDDRDNSVDRLLRLLEALLTPAVQGIDLLQAMNQHEGLDARLAGLTDALAHVKEATVIFIDNLNYCRDENVRRVLDALVFRTPPNMHLVVSDIGPLPLDMTRAKLEGRVRQIGFGDLSFNRSEVIQLLGATLAIRLSEKGISMILRQTEGWPAAVRLMQILLTETENPRLELTQFSGANEDIAVLLNRELLEGFDGRERQFLFELSLLRTFGVNLCRHVTGEERTLEYIEHLVKNNLLIIPLDRNRSWYRLHGLFREYLHAEALQTIDAERRQQLLMRAAEWCEHAGRWSDSIDYALEANSLTLASTILDRVAAMFVRDQGDLHQYIDWFERLSAGGIQCGLEANFWYVWALVFHRRFERARQQRDKLLARVEQCGMGSLSPDALNDFKRRIEVIGIGIDAYTDNLDSGDRNATRWLKEVNDNDEPFHIGTVASAAVICLSSRFELVKASDALRVAQANMVLARSDYGQGWVRLMAAAIALHRGEYAPTYQELSAALPVVRSKLGESSGIADAMAVLAAKSAIEMRLDAEAEELLDLGLRKFQTQGIIAISAFALDVAVKLWNGDPESKYNTARLREIARAYPPRMALMLSCFLIRRLLRLGRTEQALAEAESIALDSLDAARLKSLGIADTASLRDVLVATEIELDLAAGRLKHAERLVTAQVPIARQQGRAGRLAELALDEATISLRSHNPGPATRHLARAISLAAKWNYLRPFAERGDVIAAIVNETKAKDWRFAVDEEQAFFATVCRGLAAGNTALLDNLDELDVVPQLSESPTTRELEILALVEAGLSNQQLADRLSVSVATVKWHLHNLYAKFGVSSRSAALARARALNLLAR